MPNSVNLIKQENCLIFKNILLEALEKVGIKYYKLETTYEPSGVVRERVFCYELYHQIRCLQELT